MEKWVSFRAAQLGDRLKGAPGSVRVVYELMDGTKLDLHEAARLVDDAVQGKRGSSTGDAPAVLAAEFARSR